MKKLLILMTVGALLSACGGNGYQDVSSQNIKVADEKMVKNCKFLGDVTGTSALYGVFANPAHDYARNAAASDAVKLGATHIVYFGGDSSFGGTTVNGRAYKCGSRG